MFSLTRMSLGATANSSKNTVVTPRDIITSTYKVVTLPHPFFPVFPLAREGRRFNILQIYTLPFPDV